MGWNSAGEIFDPVCTLIVAAVEGKAMRPDEAERVLTTLIGKLQDGDWDVEEESLSEFVAYPFVVAAFKAQGVEVQEWMLPADEDDDSCGDCASGKCHGGDPEFCECARHSISVVVRR